MDNIDKRNFEELLDYKRYIDELKLLIMQQNDKIAKQTEEISSLRKDLLKQDLRINQLENNNGPPPLANFQHFQNTAIKKNDNGNKKRLNQSVKTNNKHLNCHSKSIRSPCKKNLLSPAQLESNRKITDTFKSTGIKRKISENESPQSAKKQCQLSVSNSSIPTPTKHNRNTTSKLNYSGSLSENSPTKKKSSLNCNIPSKIPNTTSSRKINSILKYTKAKLEHNSIFQSNNNNKNFQFNISHLPKSDKPAKKENSGVVIIVSDDEDCGNAVQGKCVESNNNELSMAQKSCTSRVKVESQDLPNAIDNIADSPTHKTYIKSELIKVQETSKRVSKRDMKTKAEGKRINTDHQKRRKPKSIITVDLITPKKTSDLTLQGSAIELEITEKHHIIQDPNSSNGAVANSSETNESESDDEFPCFPFINCNINKYRKDQDYKLPITKGTKDLQAVSGTAIKNLKEETIPTNLTDHKAPTNIGGAFRNLNGFRTPPKDRTKESIHQNKSKGVQTKILKSKPEEYFNLMKIPDIEFNRFTRNQTKRTSEDSYQSHSVNKLSTYSTHRSPSLKKNESNQNLEISHQLSTEKKITKLNLNGRLEPTYTPQQMLNYFEASSKDVPKTLERAPLLNGSRNIIESYVEEENFHLALTSLKENTSHFFHPDEKMFSAFLDMLKVQTKPHKRMDLFCTLHRITMLHPVKELPIVYELALQKPIEKQGEVLPTITMYCLFEDNVREYLGMLEKNIIPKTMQNQMLYVKFIVTLIDVDFEKITSSLKSQGNGVDLLDISTTLKSSLLWKMFWGTRAECSVNRKIKDFVKLLLDVIQKRKTSELIELGQMLAVLLRRIADCCSLMDQHISSCEYGNQCDGFSSHLNNSCHNLISCDRNMKANVWLLSLIHPYWLRIRQLEFLLQKFSGDLVPNEHKHLLKKKLSIEKIIYYYFFLYPQSSFAIKTPNPKIKTPNKTIKPLKDIKNSGQLQILSTPKNISRKNSKGETPLHVACRRNNLDKVKHLISLGADVNSSDNAGWSPLHEACCYGFEDVVDELLKTNVDVICTSEEEGFSVLHDAVRGNHVNIVRKLLKFGGSELLNIKTKNGKTAFDLAETDKMKNVLSASENGKHVELLKPMFDTEKYINLSTIKSNEVELYLLLLMELLKSFFVSVEKDLEFDARKLKKQFDYLKKHVQLISTDLTIRSNIFLNSISKMLKLKS